MTHTAQTAKAVHVSSEPAKTWVHEALEPDQLSTAKPRFGRRTFSRGTLVILWALRVYVIVMVLLIELETKQFSLAFSKIRGIRPKSLTEAITTLGLITIAVIW